MYIFTTEMEVRDYECDIQGIVNNANYLHFTEHTRHLFLKHTGLSFASLHEKGVDPVVARMTLQYKAPLQCDDVMVSKLWIEKRAYDMCFITTSFANETNGFLFGQQPNWCAS